MKVRLAFPRAEYVARGNALEVRMEGMRNTMEAGLPSVPVRTLRLALPEGTELDATMLVTSGERETRHAGGVARVPGQRPISWATNPPRHLRVIPAPRIEAERYPEHRLDVSVQKLHGVSIALVSVYPVTTNRDATETQAIDSAELTLALKPAAPRAGRALYAHEAEAVRAFVDDAAVVASHPVRDGGPSYDYLILSTSDFIGYSGENSFKDLEASLEARGMKSKIVDIASIGKRDGGDLPDKIREFIKSEYQTSGIKYVLLAGRGKSKSDNAIPARKLWSKIRAYMNGNWVDDEEQIPSDFFYAALDGPFNGNGNDKAGEPDDGENGGDVDFLPEVAVGRVVLDSTTDLQNFVRKTVYAGSHPAAKSTLMLGEELFPEKDLSGSDYLVQLEGKVTEHGFTTEGYGGDWGIEKLDDRIKRWSGSEALSKVSQGGYGMVNHLGHSNQSYNMRLSSMGGLPAFENETPFFYYTQGCLAGRFVDGSFVDKMVKHGKAAFAAIANTTYGLAPEDPTPEQTKTPGTSHMLHRQFVQAVLKGDTVGKANEASKRAFIDLKSAQEIRWVTWSTTLFGDPSLKIVF